MPQRRVELFSAGCPVCEPAVRLVAELACPDCEVTVHDLRQGSVGSALTGDTASAAAERAAALGITRVPAVAVDGGLVSCCRDGGPRRDELAAAGIGRRL